MPEYKLTYFDIFGLGEPIRLLFAAANVPFIDFRTPHRPPQFGLPSPIPPEIKQKLPYGQLPILEITNDKNGDVTILSQSTTIGRYLARQFNLYGANEWEGAKIDEIVDACMDYFHDFRRGLRVSRTDEERAQVFHNTVHVTTPKFFSKLVQLLNQNGGHYFIGNSLTWADLYVFHTTTAFEKFVGKGLIKDYLEIQNFNENIAAIPSIQKWLSERPLSAY